MTLSHTPSSRCCGKGRSNRPLNDDGKTNARREGREGEPLSTNVEELYQIKLTNLERETIMTPGYLRFC